MNITRPKSPATFKCLFAISSRNGTMTVHPCRAVRKFPISTYLSYGAVSKVMSNRTKSVYNVSSQKAGCAKYSNGVPCAAN